MPRGKLQIRTAHNVVGIDPGISCGYAWLRVDEGKACVKVIGRWNLAGKRNEGGGMQIVRLGRSLDLLFDRITKPHLIFEEVRFRAEGGIDAAHVYGEITGEVKRICEIREIPYTAMNGEKARKLALGFGRMGKPQVKAGLEKMFDRKFETCKTFDETDALKFAVAHARDLGWLGRAVRG